MHEEESFLSSTSHTMERRKGKGKSNASQALSLHKSSICHIDREEEIIFRHETTHGSRLHQPVSYVLEGDPEQEEKVRGRKKENTQIHFIMEGIRSDQLVLDPPFAPALPLSMLLLLFPAGLPAPARFMLAIPAVMLGSRPNGGAPPVAAEDV